jgi:integrase
VRGFYSRAIKEGWYNRTNPFKEFSRLPEQEVLPKFLTSEQKDKLIEIAQEQGRDIYLFCALCLYAGLRTAEAINARWTWIDFDQGNVVVQGSATFSTKSKRIRSVPTHKTLKEILEHYREADGYIINPTKEVGKWRLRYEPRKAFRAVTKAAGVEWCTPHVLRYTFASGLVQQGVSLYKVQVWLGHKSIDTTMVYSHLAPSDRDIDKL